MNSEDALVPLARGYFALQHDEMKQSGISMLLAAYMLVPALTLAEVSFTGAYSRAETTEEETRIIEGLSITFPKDQGDILEHLFPLISRHRKMRSIAVKEEASVIREVVVEQEAQVAKVVRSLLGKTELSNSFSENYKRSIAELSSVIEGWETWSGDFSHIYFYNRATASPFWNEETKVLDFGETRYTPQEGGKMNLAILPPFITRYGAGVDKLMINKSDVRGFKWDIGLYAPPGISAKATSDSVAQLFPVLSNLQHEVAKQIGSQWLRNYLIERMLQKEIEVTYFNGSDDSRHLVNGLARLYLFGFLNQVEGHRMNVLLPNLMHFPLPETSTKSYLDQVENIRPLGFITPEMEAATTRVLMLGLLKASQQIEGDLLPLQFLETKGIPIPEGGFTADRFASTIRSVYPELDETFAEAAREIATLMRTNFVADEPDASPNKEPQESAFPDSYQKKRYGNLSITAPSSLIEATDILGPGWQKGLEATSQILQKRFDRKPVPAITFEEKDYAGLRRYGVPAKKSEVELWLLQSAVTNNVEQAFFHLFDGNKIEIWFKEDLVESLEQSGDSEVFSLNSSTNEVTANFSFSIPAELFRDASVEDLLSRYGELESPVFPIVVTDSKIGDGTLDEKIAAIRKGDYIVEQIIAGAEELSPGELTGHTVGLMNEEETFFVIIHEVVEGFLIKEIIASVDRRWFCDGLANRIAMRECDRRFGEGTGQKVMSKLFPPEVSESLANQVELLAWPALENSGENIAKAEGLGSAHYDFATRAMTEALAGRDPEFVRKWLERIRETNWIRTNSATVIEAYNTLTDGDLKSVLENIAK